MSTIWPKVRSQNPAGRPDSDRAGSSFPRRGCESRALPAASRPQPCSIRRHRRQQRHRSLRDRLVDHRPGHPQQRDLGAALRHRRCEEGRHDRGEPRSGGRARARRAPGRRDGRRRRLHRCLDPDRASQRAQPHGLSSLGAALWSHRRGAHGANAGERHRPRRRHPTGRLHRHRGALRHRLVE